MMNNLLMDLPEDVFINNILLSKVMLNKSLLSLRCVCKYLRSLITSSDFVKMHLLHHSTNQLNNQLVLVDSEIPEEVFYSLKFNDGDPSRPEVVMFDPPIKSPLIWGSCNGLLCLAALAEDEDDDKVCLWNPLTKEYKDLPPPLPSTELSIGITRVRSYGYGSINYGFGYDRFIDDYKIIRCQHFVDHLDGDEKNYGDHISITEFQVYTLGTNTWRKISPDNNPFKSYFVLDFQQDKPTPFVNGALHWIMSKSDYESVDVNKAIIVSFDIEKEVFREIQSPFSELDNEDFDEFRALGGYLCVLECVRDFDHGKESCCNVWMMMDYGVKESWTKLFTILQKEVEPLLVQKEDEPFDETRLLCKRLLRFFENGEILIETCDILFIYDPINNKARHVHEFGEADMTLFENVTYMESLVSLNSGVYKGGDENSKPKTPGSELF